jgi:hypothetical protein
MIVLGGSVDTSAFKALLALADLLKSDKIKSVVADVAKKGADADAALEQSKANLQLAETLNKDTATKQAAAADALEKVNDGAAALDTREKALTSREQEVIRREALIKTTMRGLTEEQKKFDETCALREAALAKSESDARTKAQTILDQANAEVAKLRADLATDRNVLLGQATQFHKDADERFRKAQEAHMEAEAKRDKYDGLINSLKNLVGN